MQTWMMRLVRPGIHSVQLVRVSRGLVIFTKVWWSVISALFFSGLVSSDVAAWEHHVKY